MVKGTEKEGEGGGGGGLDSSMLAREADFQEQWQTCKSAILLFDMLSDAWTRALRSGPAQVGKSLLRHEWATPHLMADQMWAGEPSAWAMVKGAGREGRPRKVGEAICITPWPGVHVFGSSAAWHPSTAPQDCSFDQLRQWRLAEPAGRSHLPTCSHAAQHSQQH